MAPAMPQRTGVTAFRGWPVTLVGDPVRVGDSAPDFTVLGNDFSPVTLETIPGGVRIFSVLPSLDTKECDRQTRRFNEEASALDGVSVLTVSVDLPFAQARWCAAAGLDDVWTLSDHRDLSFGTAYGVLVAELRLLARAVFVVDSGNRVVHVQYVQDSSRQPDHDAALEAARAAR